VRTAEELRYLVLAAQREGNRLLARSLRPLGLTPSQAEVLQVLGDHQPLTLNGLGELLVCESGTNPSRLVDRLVAQGLIDRQPSARDRRHVELSLTAAGKRLTRRIAAVENRLYRAIDKAAEGRDVDEILAFLRSFVSDLPAGQALARRAERATASA
jgi:MarR family transcriptional regulator, organic hydroperoxide resistance regulator